MIADKSTTNLNFFYFFTGLGEAGLAARSEQLFEIQPGWARLVLTGGLRRKRTIVQGAPLTAGTYWEAWAISCVSEQLLAIPNSKGPRQRG